MDFKKFQVCSKCVMDTTDPDITFNDEGVCNYCLEYPEKERVRKVEARTKPWLYHEIKKGGGKGFDVNRAIATGDIVREYDCLLGLSGGVDSSLCLHYLIENGVRVLAYSVDNGWNTPESDENIMRLVEGLKVRFIRDTIDLEEFKNLQAAFIKSGTKNIEIPTDHLLLATSYELARKYKIKHIISGGNLATEGVMPKAWGYQARDLRFIRAIYQRFQGIKLEKLPTISLLGYLYNRFIRKVKVINLLDYYEYDREKAKQLLAEKYGWKDYGEKHHESVFTWWFQTRYLPDKFNIDKRKAHYSSLIHSGQMSREIAMQKLLEPMEYPAMKIDFMKYPKRSYKDYPNSEFAWNFLSKIYGAFKR